MEEGLSPGFLLIFLLPFHVTGGAAVGYTLRRLAQNGLSLESLSRSGFFLLWGLMFGCFPLLFGAGIDSIWFRLAQWGLFLGTIVVVAFCFQWLRDVYSQPGMFVATFGFAFFVLGLTVTAMTLASDGSNGLPVGLIFCAVGGILTLTGVWMLLRSGR